MSTAPLVLALATLSPTAAQVTFNGSNSESDPASIDGTVDLDIELGGLDSLEIQNGSVLTNNAAFVG